MSFSRTPLPVVRTPNGLMFPSRVDYGEPITLADQLLIERADAAVRLTATTCEPRTLVIQGASLNLTPGQARTIAALLVSCAEAAEAAG